MASPDGIGIPREFLRRINAEFTAAGDFARGGVEHVRSHCSSRRESAHSCRARFQSRLPLDSALLHLQHEFSQRNRVPERLATVTQGSLRLALWALGRNPDGCRDAALDQLRFQPLPFLTTNIQSWRLDLCALWKLVVGAAIQRPAGRRFSDAAPLLEEEGDIGLTARVPELPNPLES